MSRQNDINHISKTTINIPIQLVSVFSTQGDICPRWFRYENDRHEILKVDINEILMKKEIQFVGIRMIQYICKAIMDGDERLFELRYDILAHKWTLYQLLS